MGCELVAQIADFYDRGEDLCVFIRRLQPPTSKSLIARSPRHPISKLSQSLSKLSVNFKTRHIDLTNSYANMTMSSLNNGQHIWREGDNFLSI